MTERRETGVLSEYAPSPEEGSPKGRHRLVVVVAVAAVVLALGVGFGLMRSDGDSNTETAQGDIAEEPATQPTEYPPAVGPTGAFTVTYVPEGMTLYGELQQSETPSGATATSQDVVSDQLAAAYQSGQRTAFREGDVSISITTVAPTSVEDSIATIQSTHETQPVTVRGTDGLLYSSAEGTYSIMWADSPDRTVFILMQDAAGDQAAQLELLTAIAEGLVAA